MSRMHRSMVIVCGLCAAVLGCGGDDAIPAAPAEGTEISCGEGTVLIEDACRPAPTPPKWLCPPGELLLPNGDCQPAGVPPEACGEGFAPDGDGGCNAILPDEPCPPGMMAIPGETECREVAPCGEGDYGDIPIEPKNTQFVNASYAGDDSDGSMAKPWRTIQKAIDAAPEKGMVAVAAGSYAEDIVVEKPVRLWGRCPKLVEIHGLNTIKILDQSASGTELHTIGIVGDLIGITVDGADDVKFDRVRVHNVYMGALIIDALNNQFDGALIEQTNDTGIFINNSNTEVTRSILRDLSRGGSSSGVLVFAHGVGMADLEMTRGIVESSPLAVITNADATLRLKSMLIRGKDLDVETAGTGVDSFSSTKAARTSIQSSVIERIHDTGILAVNANLNLESTTIRHIVYVRDGYGFGAFIYKDDDINSTTVASVDSCMIDDINGDGLVVFGGDAHIKSTLVRNTYSVTQLYGRGIVVSPNPDVDEQPHITVVASVVRDAQEVGIAIAGAYAIIDGTLVQHTSPRVDGLWGRGIQIQAEHVTGLGIPSSAIIQGSLVEDSSELGIAILGADATVTNTIVRDTKSNINRRFGSGIAVSPDPQHFAHARISGSFIEESEGIGVASFGAEVELESSAVLCANGDIGSVDVNDGLTVHTASISDSSNLLCGCPAPDRTCESVRAPPGPPPPLQNPLP